MGALDGLISGMAKPQTKSIVAVARMLGAEGFTQKTAGAVRRYVRRELPAAVARRRARAKKLFSEMVAAKLSEGDRLILGRYLSHFAGEHLMAGIRLGLGCRLAPAEETPRPTR